MIVDTSALIAILRDEPEAASCARMPSRTAPSAGCQPLISWKPRSS